MRTLYVVNRQVMSDLFFNHDNTNYNRLMKMGSGWDGDTGELWRAVEDDAKDFAGYFFPDRADPECAELAQWLALDFIKRR